MPSDKRFMLEHHLFPKVAAAGRLFGYRHRGLWCTTNDFGQWERTKREWRLPG